LIAKGRKVVACGRFSKIYGLAALRVVTAYAGARVDRDFAAGSPAIHVNGIAAAAAVAALDDRGVVFREMFPETGPA